MRRIAGLPTSCCIFTTRPSGFNAIGVWAMAVETGARVITINAYAATPERLERAGHGEMFEPLQRRALDLAHSAREAAATDAVSIAGCLPPLFGSYQPNLPSTESNFMNEFNEHPAVFRTALVGIGEPGKARPVLCVELKPENRDRPQAELTPELLALGQQYPHTRDIQTILFHPAFPVDIRHNAKIFREKLAVWATGKLA